MVLGLKPIAGGVPHGALSRYLASSYSIEIAYHLIRRILTTLRARRILHQRNLT